MVYQYECETCGKKIDLEEGTFRIDTATGKYYCSDSCMEEAWSG